MAVKEVVLTNVISDVKYRCGFVGAGTGAVIRKGAVLGSGAGAGAVRWCGCGFGAGKNFCALRGLIKLCCAFLLN